MIDLKDAVQNAIDYLKDVYSPSPDGIRVEEVDTTGETWQITLGFDAPLGANTRRGLGLTYNREYKLFEVDKNNGHVLRMKMRVVDPLGA